jgi:hypothetical protein
MPKLKAKNKNAKLTVKVKLSRGEQLAERDLAMMSQRAFRGLLKPAVIKPNVLEYSGPQGTSLYDYLKQPLTGYEFHYIMAQIVRLERKLTMNGLAIKYMIVDLRYVFINPYTKELQFIYLPLSTGTPCVVIRSLMSSIACVWIPAPEEDMQYAPRFVSLIHNQPAYQPDQILAYIKRYDQRVAEQLRKTQTSASGFITNKRADYYSHYGANDGPQTENFPEDEPDTDLLPDSHPNSSLAFEETGLLDEVSDDETGLLDDPSSAEIPETEPFRHPLEETGLLDTETFPEWNEDTGLLDTETFPQWAEETGLLSEAFGDSELFREPASDSIDPGETGLLSQDSAYQSRDFSDQYPYLIRRSSNEKISINKPVFRIGKERSYVDCFISNNNAISRSHADIISRGNRYFLCDRNSTNKTYRNGYMLTPEDEVEIFDGDVLQLANEEFEFHAN